jgi:SAM-dependent methyltransferase
MSESTLSSAEYWERRAARFAGEGDGLPAVCSFGMPEFYNRAIDLTQSRALSPWLRRCTPGSILDLGCGVGRWSRRLAARGGRVTGVDLSPTMVAEAQRRTARAGLADRCQFRVGSLPELDLGERFDTIWCVTVLQHILDGNDLRAAVGAMARHLRPGGRVVLLEVAPTQGSARCDTSIFRARTEEEYRAVFAACRLRCEAVEGVDPSRLRVMLLPYYKSLPPLVAKAALAVTTAVTLPVDLVLMRRLTSASWHKVFVLTSEAG